MNISTQRKEIKMESNQIKSISVIVKPQDFRCRYWAKIIRADQELPQPHEVDGANDIKAPYSRKGDEELFASDFLIEGEENHHLHARGWTYYLTFMSNNGEKVCIRPNSEHKSTMKANGLPVELLRGAGDIAACVRIAHAVRLGIAFK